MRSEVHPAPFCQYLKLLEVVRSCNVANPGESGRSWSDLRDSLDNHLDPLCFNESSYAHHKPFPWKTTVPELLSVHSQVANRRVNAVRPQHALSAEVGVGQHPVVRPDSCQLLPSLDPHR